MAAAAGKMVGVSDSSSSEDEQLKRCREAVWETQTNKTKDGSSNVKESKRVVVAAHEHDGNELQVTKGFQTHVAKKLEHFLDSCISEKQPEPVSYDLESSNCDDDHDAGFRLFSSSVPGQKADNPPAPVRRRPSPSSSDSDSEMEARLKEAAVSVTTLLPSLTPPSALSPSSSEPPRSEKKKKRAAEEEDFHVVKRKKKRKRSDRDCEQVDSTGSARDQSSGHRGSSEQEHVEIKRKKEKKRKGNAEEDSLS